MNDTFWWLELVSSLSPSIPSSSFSIGSVISDSISRAETPNIGSGDEYVWHFDIRG